MMVDESNNGRQNRIREQTDEELARFAGEDPESSAGRRAASELLGRYKTTVYRWCFRHVQNHEQALDLAQDVLFGAYRNLGAFEGRAHFSSWIFAIARNRCFSAMRKPPLLRDEESDPDHVADPRSGADKEIESRDEEEAILRLMRRHLNPQEQQAFWLRCFERMPVDSITRLLDIRGASGARGVLQSARRKLRVATAGRSIIERGDCHG